MVRCARCADRRTGVVAPALGVLTEEYGQGWKVTYLDRRSHATVRREREQMRSAPGALSVVPLGLPPELLQEIEMAAMKGPGARMVHHSPRTGRAADGFHCRTCHSRPRERLGRLVARAVEAAAAGRDYICL